MKKNVFAQLLATWNYFSTFHLPEKHYKNEYGTGKFPPLMRALTPFTGLILGLIAVLPVVPLYAYGCTFWELAICGGVLGPFLIEFFTGRRGLESLAAYIHARREGASQAVALSGSTLGEPHAGATVFIYLLRMAFFAVLYGVHASFWIVTALVCGYLLRAQMTQLRNLKGQEFFPTEKAYAKMHYWTAGCVIAAVSLSSLHYNFLPSVIAFGVTLFFSAYAQQLCAEEAYGNSTYTMDIFGYATEMAILLLGVLIYV